MKPDFPDVIDSSIIASFRACPQKCFLETFNHWRPKVPNVHLHAGAAYAKGLEAARRAFFEHSKGTNEAEALGIKALIEAYGAFECPEDSAKSLPRMIGALEFYFSAYPLDQEQAIPAQITQNTRGIEFSFAEPIDIAHPQTGNPLIYCGRMDAIVDFAGARYGLDDKTTSQLGASWPKQWDLRSQFTGYCFGAAKAGVPLQGFLIRGVSVLKSRYDTLQALTYRPSWQIDRWHDQLLREVKRMINCWETEIWDWNLDESCTSYGGCQFRRICQSEDQTPWLNVDFERRVWNPLTRRETLI